MADVEVKWKNNNNVRGSPPTKLSKKLLPDERRMFMEIGDVDYSQNWMELFSTGTMKTLFDIVNSGAGNQKKAAYIHDELKRLGFEDLGLGTNVFAMKHPAYPGVAYKMALDSNGIADNFNDPILMWSVNDYLIRNGEKARYNRVLANDKSGLVSVQERQVAIRSQDRMGQFRKSILRVLELLAHRYLIIDLAPTEYHLNYGITRSGDWVFIDASDLYPLDNLDDELRCRNPVGYNPVKKRMERCGGAFKYNDDFSAVICKRCDHEYMPMELRPKEDERRKRIMRQFSDGMTAEEIAEQTAREEASVKSPVERKVSNARGVGQALSQNGRLRFRRPDQKPAPAPVVQEPEPEEEDDEEVVERKVVSEPVHDADSLEEAANRMVNAYDELGVGDDEEEDEDDDEEETDEPPKNQDERYGIEYIVDKNDPDPENWSVCINISGDVKAAVDEGILPIYVSFDNRETETMLFSSAEIGKRVSTAYSEE